MDVQSNAPSLELLCHQLDICNPAITDVVVADKIKRACPPGTYSWLQVRSMNFKFISIRTPTAIPARMIQFQSTNLESAQHILSIIFQKTQIDVLNLNRVVLGLLGSEDPLDRKEVSSAFWQNYTLTIYVSRDQSCNYEIIPEQGRVTETVASVFGKTKLPEASEQELQIASPAPTARCTIL